MTIDPKETILQSQFAGLGSPRRVAGFIDVPAMNVSGGITQLPPLELEVPENSFLATVMVNFSFEDVWRDLTDFENFTFNTSYVLDTTAGFDTSSPSMRMVIWLNPAYKQKKLQIQMNTSNRNTASASMPVQAYRLSAVAHIYKAPFKS